MFIKELKPSSIILEYQQIIRKIYATDFITSKIFRTIPNGIKSNYETRTHFSSYRKDAYLYVRRESLYRK